MRGTVKIEKNITRFKDRPDMPPVVVKTCYDGDQVGELAWFTSCDKFEKTQKTTNNKEQFRLIRRPASDIFATKLQKVPENFNSMTRG